MRNVFKPIDLLSILFIALLMLITLSAFPAIPHLGWLLARYGTLIIAVISLAWHVHYAHAGKSATLLYVFLPVLIVPILFDSLGDLIPWVRPEYIDELLIRADHALFSVHPTVWLERCIQPALTNTLQFAYISYYFIPLSLGITLVIKKKANAFDEAIFGIVLCFYLSYLGYIVFPAIGPRFTLAQLQTADLQAGPVTLMIQQTLNALENTKTDAFPSGHTAVALMTLYYAWKAKEKILSALLLPIVLALIFSTVYLRYHYVIDVIAGILLTVMTVYLAPVLYGVFLRAAGRAADKLHDTA